MQLHRDAAVGADQESDAGFAELLELARQGGAAVRGDLKVSKAFRAADGSFDIGDDLRRQAFLPGWIIELLGVIANVFVVEEPFDGGSPEERARIGARGALADHVDDVRRIFGCGGQAGVFEDVSAGLKAAADLVRPVRVGHRFGAGRDLDFADAADLLDALTFDEDDAVAQRAAAVAVDERAAGEGLRRGLGVQGSGGNRHREKREPEAEADHRSSV
ncbi:MAG: hypothetical protein HY235_29180 [Acidobacteria bacterium]|nr:hypothetical protein [Acidobacteriota bacterium]